jgi:zinc transport system substrate-binding protein
MAILMSACGGKDEPAAGKPTVFVSILPQAYLAERIAGGHVDVKVLVGPGDNPHSYEPTPKQMVRLGQARALLTVGMPFQTSLLEKLTLHEQLRIVDTRQGITLEPMVAHDEHDDHAHHHHARDDHGHAAGEMDPHVWMSPRLAGRIAANIADALAEIDPAHAEDFQANLADLQADLNALDGEIARALEPLKGRTFYVYHPAFGYFARRYGLVQEAVEIGGKSPGPRHVKELIDRAKADGVRVVFVQPQFSDKAARTIAAQIDGAVVPIDPLARDYISNLQSVAATISQALSPDEE